MQDLDSALGQEMRSYELNTYDNNNNSNNNNNNNNNNNSNNNNVDSYRDLTPKQIYKVAQRIGVPRGDQQEPAPRCLCRFH